MLLNVNGNSQEIHGASSVGDLLRQLELTPIQVAVELNKDLVPRKEFDQTKLCDGDNLEIVTLVGGG